MREEKVADAAAGEERLVSRGSERGRDVAGRVEGRAVFKPQNHSDLSLDDAAAGCGEGKFLWGLKGWLDDVHGAQGGVADPDKGRGQGSGSEAPEVRRLLFACGCVADGRASQTASDGASGDHLRVRLPAALGLPRARMDEVDTGTPLFNG